MDSKLAGFLFFNLLFFVSVSSCNVCKPVTPAPVTPSPVKPAKCPKDTLKLGICADLLGGLVKVELGTPSGTQCCGLLKNLADLNAGLCLCTAIKANVLGIIKLDVPVAVSLLVNACGIQKPEGFKCT